MHYSDSKVGISVIICCYNSAERLPQTLKHLAEQTITDQMDFEIIIVDNASQDSTGIIAKKIWDALNNQSIPFSVITEPKSGKINALSTGVQHAQFDYMLICDDDNWLATDYVQKAFNIITSNKNIGAVGGRSTPVYNKQLPSFFEENQHKYAVGRQHYATADVTHKMYLWGAGMTFRKNDYLKMYAVYPSVLLGPNEDLLTRGEDVEFCMRLIFMGYRLQYNDDLVFKHFIPDNRLTEEYKERFFKGNSYENLILDLYIRQIKIIKKKLGGKISMLIFSSLRFLIKKLFQTAKWDINFESENIFMITGLQLKLVSPECMLIRKIFLNLRPTE